ncbi:MAG: SUMF1/EgtB/PvdO family nonheme iron enzyme [Bacteroidales bacterium]|nr:MAG: SUMF1/EgtB/PvdO family nonheme iron enzyme [Bacteroidales bacterium]
MNNKVIPFLFSFVLFLGGFRSEAQPVRDLILGVTDGLVIRECMFADSQFVAFPDPPPLFTFEINDSRFSSAVCQIVNEGNTLHFSFNDMVYGNLVQQSGFSKGWKATISFRNISDDTLKISNIVPFGISDNHIYITGTGSGALARTKIFIPGKGPVGVILPDNAWEMGYASVPLPGDYSICGIARRTDHTDAQVRRYETFISPGGNVTYTFYIDRFTGEWQNGLKLMFHERYLFDLEEFNDSLYRREDLKWIRNKYTMVLQAAWDIDFYDRSAGRYNFYTFLEEGKKFFGGWDIFCLWPTWPRLGVDQRNQWDLYEDLPLGLEKIRELAAYARNQSTYFFITYNPWDKSTRQEDHYRGMARLIQSTDADGVVLDTRGSSSYELQHAADSVKRGIIMYSEGMAVPADMPGIVSGRVHNAIVMSPPLNLNKLIKPEFSIFRVVQRNDYRIHREIAIAFFNGYGTEINTFAPGRPDWLNEDYTFLGRTTKILRENSSVFLNDSWTPLVHSTRDSIWVNEWKDGEKTLYTILSFNHEGYHGPLFEADTTPGYHYVSLWNHEELEPEQSGSRWMVPVKIKAFNKQWLNTRKEGRVDCVARLPRFIQTELIRDSLFLYADKGDKIVIWKGMPSYQGVSKEFGADTLRLRILDLFGQYEDKIVIQLFGENSLLDECVIKIQPGEPRRISRVEYTKRVRRPFANMEEIPAGDFSFSVTNPDQFIPYPDYSTPRLVHVERFFMDKYPVTNAEYYEFMVATGYQPRDPTNFLKHWENGIYPQGQDNYPVVYVSLEDAKAYAEWSGKRLPTEIEWQYAAQGTDGRTWPWGDEFHSTKCNDAFERPTPVDAFPKGMSPFNIEDLVGNVWQMTNDIYDNGSYRFNIIRGGSYFKPTSSQWYVRGGPQPLNHTQMLLLVSPGFDRNATVGFRCVKDAE